MFAVVVSVVVMLDVAVAVFVVLTFDAVVWSAPVYEEHWLAITTDALALTTTLFAPVAGAMR
jgi:hypothetical protein